MIEIIKRGQGIAQSKEQIAGKPQVSYNSHGHLVVRAIQSEDNDTLVVFDARTSREIINFCQQVIRADFDRLPF